MPSNFIKIILALSGLAPALLLLYILKIKHDFLRLSVYINIKSLREVVVGINLFFESHFLIIFFILLVVVARYIIVIARTNLSIGRIDVKSVKPGDSNFTTVIFSIIPFLVKLYSPEVPDKILLLAVIAAGIVLGVTMKASYHFNLTLKLMGYSHYEVQTKEEVTYLMLSKKQLINRNAISKYVKLADHMLLNVSDKK